MGLLDMLGGLDSADGRFALGLLAAARPQPVRTGLGEGLLAALNQADAYRQEQERRRVAEDERRQRAALQALQMEHIRSQIGETTAQARQREQATLDAQRKAVEAERAAKDQGAFLASPFVQAPTGAPSFMVGSGERTPEANAAAAAGATRPKFDFATAARLFGVEHALKLMQGMDAARNFGLDKVAGQVETTMPGTNRPGTMLRDEFGRPVGNVLPKAVELQTKDLGGSLQVVDPFALSPGQSFAKTQTPDSKASNALGWANFGLARDRLALDQSAPKGQYDPERGLMIDARTGVATPVTQGDTPIGPKDKNLTDSQAKSLLFGTRMQRADEVFRELSKEGTTWAMPGATMGLGIGDAMNLVMTENQQRLVQAQRDFLTAVLRRESGAVISPSEFAEGRRSYFPQPGDRPANLEQKARARATAIAGVMSEVPEGKRSLPSSQAASPVVRTGVEKGTGRKVVERADGSIEYAD